ncbi:MAG: NADH:ubiquinone oxidoreductase [Thermoplasmatales archaeon B_DKE]|nr:MAG: NADH:ubiquinone oxidoreductase [Thermoplasmatales archaeon B_DKE]
MSNLWFFNGLRKGVRTERFPNAPAEAPPQWPSRLSGSGDAVCPVGAIENGVWDMDKCIFCRRCLPTYEPTGEQDIFTVDRRVSLFHRSLYLYPLDSGSCGGCNIELLNIFTPYYDANRLRIFITNTPRHADAIVIMGVYTKGMEEPLRLAYEAMAEPKLVIALGACAISGGIVGKPAIDTEKYNVKIAGCPPSPYTILQALDSVRGD